MTNPIMRAIQNNRRILMVISGLVGALIGWFAWVFVLSYSQSTFIVSIGQVGQGSPSGAVGQQVRPDQTFLEDPAAFIERIRSPAFASSIVARTGAPELREALPAWQYGGLGRLSVRSLRPPSQGLPNLIEVRIASLNPDLAQAAARAAVEQIVEDHSKLLEPFVKAMKKREELLEVQIRSLLTSGEENNRKIADLNEPNASDLTKIATVGAKLFWTNRTLDLELTAYDARLALLTQDFRKTMVLFEPALAPPRRFWIVGGPLSGALAGVIFAFLAIRIAREIAQRRAPAAAPVA